MSQIRLRPDVELRSLTTLEVGGPVRALAGVDAPEALREVLALATDRSWPVAVLGGGSNVLASDRGFAGVLVQWTDAHLLADTSSGRIRVGAGHDWDALVQWAVAHDLAGLECLSGIPGRVGAAPIQNVGAYGHEIAELLVAVHAVDLRDGHEQRIEAEACDFGYRDSRFKRDWRGRWCVTAVELQLEPGGRPRPAYAELARSLEDARDAPALSRVREAVLAIRRRKSMVLDPTDPNRRSAGSFFTNPVVDEPDADRIEESARRRDAAATLPRWPVDGGRVKIPAAWLIEHSGLHKGYREGAAGLSDHHVLALVNRGGATAEDLLRLARSVRDRVLDRFEVRLVPEPVPLGFQPEEVDDLWRPAARGVPEVP